MPNINHILTNTNLVNTYSPKQKPDGLQVNFTFLTEKTKDFFRIIKPGGSFNSVTDHVRNIRFVSLLIY